VKLFLRILATLVGLVLVVGLGTYAWASWASSKVLSRTFTVHSVDFPIPFPLDTGDVARLRIDTDSAQRLALAQAIDRGKHLVESRYVCIECHGPDFSGGTMMDVPLIGRFLGPNITAGTGGRTGAYAAGDWDRIVRHGVRPDGTPATMPSDDFKLMSDQELSDIVAYVRSRPTADKEVPPVSLGPLGRMLVATGQFKLSADMIESHDTPHRVAPPEATVSVEFGRHLAGVCTGCHQADLAGGKMVGGDPSWVPAANLTPHETGQITTWTLDDFKTALREGKRPDGTDLRMPMSLVVPYGKKMNDLELEALWTYIRSVPPVPSR